MAVLSLLAIGFGFRASVLPLAYASVRGPYYLGVGSISGSLSLSSFPKKRGSPGRPQDINFRADFIARVGEIHKTN